MAMNSKSVLRAVLWRRRDVPGLEHFRLWQDAAGPRLEGTVVAALDGVPLEARYTVACTPAWETRWARVEVASGGDAREIELETDDTGAWWLDDRRLDALDGCPDVDLGITPSTNILPIRRLALDVGDARDVTAVWVRFPDLTVMTLPQRYTRLVEDRYRYESRGGAFVADLDVDELGLVIRYGEFWERAGSAG